MGGVCGGRCVAGGVCGEMCVRWEVCGGMCVWWEVCAVGGVCGVRCVVEGVYGDVCDPTKTVRLSDVRLSVPDTVSPFHPPTPVRLPTPAVLGVPTHLRVSVWTRSGIPGVSTQTQERIRFRLEVLRYTWDRGKGFPTNVTSMYFMELSSFLSSVSFYFIPPETSLQFCVFGHSGCVSGLCPVCKTGTPKRSFTSFF